MLDMLKSLDAHWIWLSLGVLLAAAEIVAPGFFLMWFALAAIVTGILAWLLPIAVPAQLGVFAVLSVIAVYAGRRWFSQNPIHSDDPQLNDRAARMTGETVTVVDAIAGGEGRVRVGDGVWTARGPDAGVGARMLVTGVSGTVLLVEPAN